MTDRATIIAEYDRQEQAGGGLACASSKVYATRAAEALGLTYEEVLAVLSDHWSGMQG
jgi:hypothetical protein